MAGRKKDKKKHARYVSPLDSSADEPVVVDEDAVEAVDARAPEASEEPGEPAPEFAPPSPAPKRDSAIDPVLEWRESLALVQRLDDTLLRVRVLVLPWTIAVIVAGAIFATMVDRVSVDRWVLVGLCIVAAVKVLGLGVLSYFGYRSYERWWLRLLELIPFVALAVFLCIWAGFIADRDPGSFSVAGPVLALGSLWLLLLYLMDRCSFIPRLTDATARAEALELSLRGDDAPLVVASSGSPWLSNLLPMALYFVPILVLASAGLAVIAFGGADRADQTCRAEITLGLRNRQLALGLGANRSTELANCVGALPALPAMPSLRPGNR
jgi:hypothetical protein